MARNLFAALLILAGINLSAQSYKKDKVTGIYPIYLDSLFQPIDSSAAFYYGYGYFENGNEVTAVSYPTQSIYDYTYNGVPGKKGAPRVLHGTFKLKSFNNTDYYLFENGYPVSYTGIDNSGYDSTYYNHHFDSLYQGQPGTWYFEKGSRHYSSSGWYRNGKYGRDYYAEQDSRGLICSNAKYPYVYGRVPPFVGITAGLEGFRNRGYELGLAFHLDNFVGENFGGMNGLLVSFKNRFDQSYYTLTIEQLLSDGFVFGMGYNYNGNGTDDTHSFRMCTGISFFNLQLVYGYNFFKNSKNEIQGLMHHTFSARYVLPVWRIRIGW